MRFLPNLNEKVSTTLRAFAPLSGLFKEMESKLKAKEYECEVLM